MNKNQRIIINLLLLFFIAVNVITAQKFILKGRITNSNTNEPLSFANLRIDESTFGTSANIEGNYELRLIPRRYSIITSFIGFKSDTAEIDLAGNFTLNISLIPISIELPEITVLPGVNPALAIIKKAIINKHERDDKLDSYVVYAYTKGLIRTTEDIISTDRSVGLEVGNNDSTELRITGIIENETKGYFKKPDSYNRCRKYRH